MSHATNFGSLLGASKLRRAHLDGPSGIRRVELGAPQAEYDRVRLKGTPVDAIIRARKAREARLAALRAGPTCGDAAMTQFTDWATLAGAMAAEFRVRAQARRAAAEKQTVAVENFPGVFVRSPETVMALRTAETLDAIADDLEKLR